MPSVSHTGSHSASLYRVPVHSRLETLSEFLKVAREFAQCPGIEQVKVTSGLSESEQHLLLALAPSETPTSCLLFSLLGWRASEGAKAAEDCIIQCSMCSRRIGLWGFIDGTRALHVALEHKTYCPYVNRQTQSAGQGSRPEEPDNAWRQRLQVLVGGGTRGQGTLSQDQVRTMRSSEVLAKVKSMMM